MGIFTQGEVPYGPQTEDNFQEPLFSRIQSGLPTGNALIGFNQRRGANTILKGGFLDTNKTTGAFFRRNDQLQRFRGTGSGRTLTSLEAGGRFGRGSWIGPIGLREKRAYEAANDITKIKSPLVRPYMKNNMDPRGLFRRHSISAVSGMPGTYNAESQLTGLGNMLFGSDARKAKYGVGENDALLSSHFLAHTRAASQMDVYESKLSGLSSKISERQAAGKSTARLSKRAERYSTRLTKAQQRNYRPFEHDKAWC